MSNYLGWFLNRILSWVCLKINYYFFFLTSTYKKGSIVMISFFIQLLSDCEAGKSASARPLTLDST